MRKFLVTNAIGGAGGKVGNVRVCSCARSGAFVLLLLLSPLGGRVIAAQGSHSQGAAQQKAEAGKPADESCCVATIPSKPGTVRLPDPASGSLIPWNEDFQKASAEAVKRNKPMLIEFWAGWCAVCKVVDKELFSDPKIAAEIRDKFVPVKVNFDADIAMDKTYAIKNLPTVAFTDSYGSELLRTFGVVKADAFSKILADFPADMTRINAFDRTLTVNRNDLQALYGFADEARRSKLYRLSNTTYDHVLKIERNPQKKELVFAAQGLNYIALKDSKNAVRAFEKCLDANPASSHKPLCMTGLGKAYAEAGNRDGARETLTAVIAQYPNTPDAEKAKQTLSELR
jgi:thiol-disulfide isomerase/thioredoxin